MYTSGANECSGKIMKGLKVCFGFFITQPQSSVESEPGVGSFHNVAQSSQAASVFTTTEGLEPPTSWV